MKNLKKRHADKNDDRLIEAFKIYELFYLEKRFLSNSLEQHSQHKMTFLYKHIIIKWRAELLHSWFAMNVVTGGLIQLWPKNELKICERQNKLNCINYLAPLRFVVNHFTHTFFDLIHRFTVAKDFFHEL